MPNPFEKSNLPEDEIRAIGETFDLLESRLGFTDEYLDVPELDFAIFKHYHHASVTVSYPVSPKSTYNGYIAFMEVTIKESGKYGPNYHGYVQMWAIAELNTTFDTIVIRPETMMDKVHELIEPVELDFKDDPEFSKKFYVITDTKESAAEQLNQDYREAIRQLHLKEFFLEFNKNLLVIGTRKRIDTQTTLELVDFLIRIKKIQDSI